MSAELLVEVIRGQIVESVHRGHLAAVDGSGTVVFQAGDPGTTTFYRSACKAFQAMPLITSGAVDRFGFDNEEIALAAASHSGEPRHVEIAGRMLAKIGLKESDLRCGTHSPFNEAENRRLIRSGERPTQLHNNCSGKHAAMLALALHLGVDITKYESLESPVQRDILRCVASMAEIPEDHVAVAVDGCAAPNFAVPVIAMARSFANLVNPAERFPKDVADACLRLVTAMTEHPFLIGGTDRMDTQLMEAAPGRLISKVGADGVWLCGVLPSDRWPQGLGIALKIEDGDDLYSRPVVAAHLLRQLGVLSNDSLPDFSPWPIKNRRGDVVGQIRPAFNTNLRS